MPANQLTKLSSFDEVDEKFWNEKPILETLKTATNFFLKYIDNTVQIWAASRDWFMEEWGRDTFISLPGLLLVNKKFEEARKIFERFGSYEKDGLIPNRINNNEIIYNSADASLWFIRAQEEYVKYTNDWGFIKKIMPINKKILESYINGTGYFRYGKFQRIYMDKDYLIVSPPQATWMDADAFGKIPPVTPRNGKAVEINSLFYKAIKFIEIAEEKTNIKTNLPIKEIRENLKKSFEKKFWNEKINALYDVIEGDPNGASIRPNMIIAVSDGEDLIPIDKQISVFNVVKEHLLTPGGLRTLSPTDPNYKGTYNTYLPIEEKDLSYHQGTAWPWLFGRYIDTLVKIMKYKNENEESIKKEIKRVLGPIVKFCLESEYKSLPELFSGDWPYEPGGTTSQAFSVAEVLRVIIEYKILS